MLKEKIGEMVGRLPGGKRTKLILLLGLAAMAAILLSEWIPSGESAQESAGAQQVSADQYASALEIRLAEIVSAIDGAGETNVLITLQNGVEYIYASEEKMSSDTNENGSGSDSESTLIILDGDGGERALVRTELMPKVCGVLVVCEGAGDPAVSERIMQAVTTALGVSSKRVYITQSSQTKQEAEQ